MKTSEIIRIPEIEKEFPKPGNYDMLVQAFKKLGVHPCTLRSDIWGKWLTLDELMVEFSLVSDKNTENFIMECCRRHNVFPIFSKEAFGDEINVWCGVADFSGVTFRNNYFAKKWDEKHKKQTFNKLSRGQAILIWKSEQSLSTILRMLPKSRSLERKSRSLERNLDSSKHPYLFE
jgi:hypothetical protein